VFEEHIEAVRDGVVTGADQLDVVSDSVKHTRLHLGTSFAV
jgi:hypothetical protein